MFAAAYLITLSLVLVLLILIVALILLVAILIVVLVILLITLVVHEDVLLSGMVRRYCVLMHAELFEKNKK